MQTKYLFITGGVVSSLGKGLTSASIGTLLENRGQKVLLMKLDPYLNVDPGTMNPLQHGEVYVTDDGAETDLDLGHYHRFTNSPLTKYSNLTSGQAYDAVIRKERRGDFLGSTVQVIPHITDQIKNHVYTHVQTHTPDIVLIEIGGTVGDIESLPFIEAIRQIRLENQGHSLNMHLTYVPYLKAAGELKTKPTQHSVQMLRQIGLIPDLIVCRSEDPLPKEIKEKIALFCSVPKKAVFDEPDVKHSIYEVPLNLRQEGIDQFISEALSLEGLPSPLVAWERIVETIKKPTETITVGIFGKYLQHQDAYKSVFESLNHAAISAGYKLKIEKIDTDSVTKENLREKLSKADGVLVPGGFGKRGWEEKILCAQYCRENQIPYFGICLGMQIMTVEFARHVVGIKEASSTEMDPQTKAPIISLLSEQEGMKNLGGTMRLGAYPCSLTEGSKAYQAYGSSEISERHRHRYEFNNSYKAQCEEKGMFFSGICQDENLCEIAEIKDHPWMVGVQFHPEFKSKPTEPHPLFASFIKAIIESKDTTKVTNS